MISHSRRRYANRPLMGRSANSPAGGDLTDCCRYRQGDIEPDQPLDARARS
jgi:hypothetical protein